MKKEFPEEDDLLLVTVDRVIGASVFVKLDEYSGKEGVINFSEVAPGRIRNIRDYIKPGQKIVCKILRADKLRGHFDLSLRRVSLKEKKAVAEKYKKRNDFFVLLNVAIENKDELNDIKNKLKEDDLDLVLENIDKRNFGFFSQFGILEKDTKRVFEIMNEKIKNKRLFVRGKFALKCELSDGLLKIKNVLNSCNEKGIKITYIGAPNYLIDLEGNDYKELNKKLNNLLALLEKKAKENSCFFEIEDK